MTDTIRSAPAASTYQAPRYDGGTRERCAQCGKVVVARDMETARLRASQISARSKDNPRYHCVMKAYLGKCGHWHVSRRRTHCV